MSGGSPGYQINWTGPTNGNPNGIEIPVSSGSYLINGLTYGIYSITIIDGNGCDTSLSIFVNQPNTPISLNTQTDSLTCFNSNDGSINLIVSGGTAPYTYLWSNNMITEDLSGLPSNNYIVNVTDDNGCQASLMTYVGQPNPIVINSTLTNILCHGDTSGFINISVSGGTPNYSFLWNNGAVTEDLSNIPVGGYLVTVTDANGCVDSALYDLLHLSAPLEVDIDTINVSCFGGINGSVDLTLTGGAQPYYFLWSNGEITEDIHDLNVGIYDVTITDANGCVFNESIPITQPLAPLIILPTIYDAPCFELNGGSIELIVSGGNAPYTYFWNTGDTTQNVDSLGAGQYTVVVSDINQCASTLIINVSQPQSAMIIGSTTTNPSCYGYTNGSASVSVSGGNSPYNYQWSNGGTLQTINNLPAGTYSVEVTDANGCTLTEEITISQPDSLIAQITLPDTLGCIPFTAQLINSSIGQYASAVWEIGNGDIIVSSNSANYTFNQLGCFDISLTISSANGCVSSSTLFSAICVVPGPDASFFATTDEIDFYSGLLQLVNTSQGVNNSYQWYFSDGYQSNIEHPTHYFPSQQNSTYDVMLIAIDSNGCIDTAIQNYIQQEVNVMNVPNSITANQDDLNDLFRPVFALPDIIKTYEMEIYNRWGQLIYSTNSQYDGWDGHFKGKECPIGVYSWKIKYTDIMGTAKNAHGHVSIIR